MGGLYVAHASKYYWQQNSYSIANNVIKEFYNTNWINMKPWRRKKKQHEFTSNFFFDLNVPENQLWGEEAGAL